MYAKFMRKQYENLKSRLDEAILRTAASGNYLDADRVLEFEEELAKYIDIKNVIACDSAADAMELVLLSYGIGDGDAVFISCLGSPAMADAVKAVGATPVFVDVDVKNGSLDLHNLEVQIQRVMTDTPLSPKIVVSTDCFGIPADYLAVNEIIRTYGLLLLVDVARSLGGSYRGLKCGCFGHASITSFAPGSPLACMGNGGAVLTDFNDLAGLVHACRQNGKINGKIEMFGMDSTLDVMQSEILRVKLQHLDEELALSAQAATVYDEALKEHFALPNVPEGAVPSYSDYVILAEDAEQAEKIKDALKAEGLYEEQDEWVALNTVLAFYDERYEQTEEKFAGTEELLQKAVRLPISPYIDKAEQDKVIAVIKGCLD